jgi:hypothetical protein
LKGGEAEQLVRAFLRGHLPKRFDVGSGFIIDPRDALSKQTDVIIYDALNCPVYRASETAAIIPSDNVAAVIEVKSRLDKERMQEAFENISAAKSLSKLKPQDVPFLVTAQTFGCLFAFETDLSLQKLMEHYCECIKKFHLGRHIDLVLVLDKGVISLATKMPGMGWAALMMEGFGGRAAEGAPIAASAMPMGEDSLDVFLRFLLAKLIHFRGVTGHPGFDWTKGGTAMPPQVLLSYLTSITNETDPILREKKLREYAEQVQAEFEGMPR